MYPVKVNTNMEKKSCRMHVKQYLEEILLPYMFTL